MRYHGGPLVCYHKHLWSEWLFAHLHCACMQSDDAISLQFDTAIDRGITEMTVLYYQRCMASNQLLAACSQYRSGSYCIH